MIFLSAEQVVTMHADQLARWGGEEGGGHRGSLYEGAEAAVQAVKNSYYETTAELGAAYAVYIVQGHVFQDANKRTGATSMLTFMVANGLNVETSSEDIFRLMVTMQERAESGEKTDSLVAWLVDSLVIRRRSSRTARRSSKRRSSKR